MAQWYCTALERLAFTGIQVRFLVWAFAIELCEIAFNQEIDVKTHHNNIKKQT